MQIARRLIAAGADINGYHTSLLNQELPLHATILEGDLAIIHFLVENGAVSNSLYTSRYGRSILQHASVNAGVRAVVTLLNAGADVTYVDEERMIMAMNWRKS